MTTLSINHNTKLNRLTWTGLLVFQIVTVLLYSMGLKFISVLPLFALLFFFSVSNFRFCFYLFIFSLFLGQYLFPGEGTRVADFILAILILSYLAKVALRGEFSLHRTPLDKPILLFLGILGNIFNKCSGFGSGD